MNKRGRPRKPLLVSDRKCETCGTLLVQSRYDDGRLERVEDFERRRFCCRQCVDLRRSAIPCEWCGRKAIDGDVLCARCVSMNVGDSFRRIVAEVTI